MTTLREQYNRDGYVVAKNLFSPYTALCAETSIYDSFVKYVLLNGNAEECMSFVFNKNAKHYLGALSLASRSTHLEELFFRSDVTAFLQRNIFPDYAYVTPTVLHVLRHDLKIPGGYFDLKPHQDWPSSQGSLNAVTAWIPLTYARIGNFPLEVIPGSHLQGLKEGKENGSVMEIECDEKDFVPVECVPGDVVFFSAFTIHRSGVGNPNAFRMAASKRFETIDSSFIKRGYPCVQKRIVDRSIKWEPNVEQIRSVFE